MTRARLIAAAPLLVLLAVPLAVSSSYLLHLLILVLLWIVLGQAWNLIGGYTGQISYGHAAFFGVGAYTTALIYQATGSAAMAWWGLLAGGITAALLAIVIGWICFRLRGPYFGLSVLALAEVLRLVATNWKDLTNGAEGILFIPAFTSKAAYFYIIAAILLATVATMRAVVGSRLGYYFLAIREDQDAAESLGIDTTKYKMISLMISAFLTGVGGAFYTNYFGYIDPGIVFNLQNISILMILIAILGGVATIWGPVVGATLYILIAEGFRVFIGAGHLVFFGALIIVIVIFFPNGIVGAINDRRAARARSSAPGTGTPGTEAAA